MQVEGLLSENRDLGLSRPKRGFDSRWGRQENQAVVTLALFASSFNVIKT